MTDDILDQIDNTIDGKCGHCARPIPPNSPSAYYCDADCQRRFYEGRATEPTQVYYREDAATYPGGPMTWAPDMLTHDPGEHLREVEEVPAVLGPDPQAWPRRRVFRRTDRPAWFLRVDDRYRFVGRDVLDTTLDGPDAEQHVARTWQALVQELGNRSHVAAAPSLRDPLASASARRDVHVSMGTWLDGFFTSDRWQATMLEWQRRRGVFQQPQRLDEDVWADWVDLGWVSDLAAPPPCAPRLGEHVDAALAGARRPVAEPPSHGAPRGLLRRRWCQACGGQHDASPPPIPLCTCCGERLPVLTYEAEVGEHRWVLRLRTGDFATQATLEARTARQQVQRELERMDQVLVRQIRQSYGITRRCRTAWDEMSRQLRLQARLAILINPASPMSRAALGALPGPTPDPAPEAEHPMQAELRRRRERQGHTGPQAPARAPRSIPPRGGLW